MVSKGISNSLVKYPVGLISITFGSTKWPSLIYILLSFKRLYSPYVMISPFISLTTQQIPNLNPADEYDDILSSVLHEFI